MPDALELNLPWPIKGLDRRLAYRRQPPFSAPSCLNVVNADIYEDRVRGGTRNGLQQHFFEQLGAPGGDAVNFMGQVRSANTVIGTPGVGGGESFYTSFVDNFDGPGPGMGDLWTVLANAVSTPTIFGASEFGNLQGVAANIKQANVVSTHQGAALDDLALLDNSQQYTVQMLVEPGVPNYVGYYDICVLMDNTSPNPGNADFGDDSDVNAVGVTCRLFAHWLGFGTLISNPNHYTVIYNLQMKVRAPGGMTALYSSNTVTANPFNGDPDVKPETMRVEILPDSTITFRLLPAPYEGGTGLTEISVNLMGAGFNFGTNRRVGFALNPNFIDVEGYAAAVAQWFGVQYFAFGSAVDPDNPPPFPSGRNNLVASAGSILYITDPNNADALIEADQEPEGTNLNFDRNLIGVERESKLYIADYGTPKVQSTTGEMTTAFTLTDLNVNFDQVDIDLFNDVLVIEAHRLGIPSTGSELTMFTPWILPNVYRIVSFTGNTIQIQRWTLVPNTCSSIAPAIAGGCGASDGSVAIPDVTYRIERGPKVFDPRIGGVQVADSGSVINTHRTLLPWNEAGINPTDNTANRANLRIPVGFFTTAEIATYGLDTLVREGDFKGILPVGSRIISRYRDRMVMTIKNRWFMSRAGDPFDWYLGYSLDDEGRPMTDDVAEGGVIGQTITSVMPHTDDYCLFGTLSELWVMRGDPASTGAMERLSGVIGVIDNNTWCYGPQGELFWLSRDGLYRLSPGASSFPESISRERLPLEFQKLNPDLYIILMNYDVKRRSVDIWITPKQSQTANLHWFFDWEFPGFWPLDIPSQMESWSAINYESDSQRDSFSLIGGRDGYIRKLSRSSSNDDGFGFESHVLLGPFQMGENDLYDGWLNEFVAVMADASGDAQWTVYVGKTPEEAYRNFQNDDYYQTGVLTNGLNPTHRPRCRGHSLLFKISSPLR